MKRPQPFLWVAAFLFIGALPAKAVPPIHPEDHPGGATCHFNERLYRARTTKAAVDPGLSAQVNLSTPSVLVIRADFSDRAMAVSLSETQAFFNRVRGFYEENSYGVFQPTFTITSTIHRLGSMATYGNDCGSNVACRADELMEDAVQAENVAGRDFSAFHHVMIYHAGNGQESSGSGPDIWSVYLPDEFTVDGTLFTGFTTVPETEAGNADPLGVTCHEYGHQLGLPDLYDVSFSGGYSTVGTWDVMDYPYGAASGGAVGSNPSHFGAWSKKLLGFLTPVTLQSSATLSLLSSNVSSQTFLVPAATSDLGPNNEYFLLEYRNKVSTSTYDKGIPGSGLLIWHIDETLASNATRLEENDINSPSLNGRGRRGVDLVEADFTSIYQAPTRGQPTDAFDSSRPFLSPLSDSFSGVPTGVFISDISGVEGTQISFDLELPTLSTFTLSSQVAVSTSLNAGFGTLSLQLPAGAVSSEATFFVSPLSAGAITSIENGSYVTSLSESGAGFLVALESNLQPVLPVAAQLSFSAVPALTSLSNNEKLRITLARYDPRNRVWVPVPTLVDPAQNSLQSSLTHFSLFQIMQVTGAPSFSGVKIYPNPMRPSLGPSYGVINFMNLPVDSTVRLYSVDGNLVRELRPNASGLAVWDGKNDSGQEAASGVYIAVYEDQDGKTKKRTKVAIER